MSVVSDLERAIANAWEDLADAEAEHDSLHAERAVAELIRLNQLIPRPRNSNPS